MNSLPRHAAQAAIDRIDAQLRSEPSALHLRFDRGQFLELLGRGEDALSEYLALIEIDPAHVDALNAAGSIFLSVGQRDRARSLFAAAVIHGFEHAQAHANLAYLELLDGNFENARELYGVALELDPQLAIAYHGLAEIAERSGDPRAAAYRADGLRHRPVTISRFTGRGRPIVLLALGSAAFGNVATAQFFDSDVFQVASIVVEHFDPQLPLPPHDVIFNVIGEADLCAKSLVAAAALAARSDAPVINSPSAVRATTRAANARRFAQLPGVIAPRIEPLARSALLGPDARRTLAESGFVFPLLVRSPGFHTGEHFVRVEHFADLAAAIEPLPGEQLLVIEYLDARDRDGNARKYRAMIVDGELYPLHLAICGDWKVHYFRADMKDRADHRAADLTFLADMEAAIGSGAVAALHRIRDVLGLDFGGIDFGLDADGNVIVFEANASMIVPYPDADERWDYRRAPVERIHTAVRRMLVARASLVGAHGSCTDPSRSVL